MKPWHHDKSTRQLNYKELLKVIVNPETNEYYPARNKHEVAIKGTGTKHIVRQIIRIRRKDGKEYLYTQRAISGYDALGNGVRNGCRKVGGSFFSIFIALSIISIIFSLSSTVMKNPL